MSLIDLVKQINNVCKDLIIFLKNMNDYNSDLILAYPEEDDNGIKIENGNKYYYLLVVFLAKEFISD